MDYKTKSFTASATISKRDIYERDRFAILTAGIVLTLPTPAVSLKGRRKTIVNDSSGYASVACSDGFLNNVDSIVIAPRQSVFIECFSNGTTYYWSVTGPHIRSEELITWSPTLTFTTATPTLVNESYHAYIDNGVVKFHGYAKTTDGAGATALTITLPLRPKDRDIFVPIEARVIVDGTPTDVLGYIESANGTAANRLVAHFAMPTWTDNKTCEFWFAGFYEPVGAGWETFAPTVTYGTSNFNSATEVHRCKDVDGVCFFTSDIRTTDAKGVTSSISFTPPAVQNDTNVYVPVMSIDNCTAGDDSVDYDNMLALLDATNTTEGSRIIASHAIGVCANGKAAQAYFAGFCEQYGWDVFTPVHTFTGTAPTAAVNNGRYKVIDKLCYFVISYETTDGNGCTAHTISGLPVPPKYVGASIPLWARQVVNTTYRNPMALLRTDEAASGDRIIEFQNLATYTDAVAGKNYIAGFYPVG